jgi:N4-gp56 family major capsid protein
VAVTTKATQIVPDVWGPMVQAEFLGKLVLNQAAGFTLTDNTLVGKPGDTVHFPKFGALTDAEDLTEATAMVPEAMSTSDDTATIKEVGKAVEISDTAKLTAYGDPLAEIRRQLGVVVARKVDTDLKAVAEAAGALTHDAYANGNLSWASIAAAIAKFGDQWDPSDMAGMVIHSKQQADLFVDANFISRDKLGEQAVIPRGVIGQIAGMNVFVSDRVTKFDYDAATAGDQFAYKSLLVKRNALGLLYKRRPIVENDRDILKRTDVVTTNVHYAVKRLNDKGVLVLTTA